MINLLCFVDDLTSRKTVYLSHQSPDLVVSGALARTSCEDLVTELKLGHGIEVCSSVAVVVV